ncbi:MAG: hypothetical protein K2Z81_09220 [Cyanobacteria bacterium]|jgi:CheY-like chemotaxis protein|nr:hypothetical protein [Candidatus Obscuribacterales bacterium]MBX9692553.1 hypothetical protein [Cyanobacteriota bacterium]
MSEEIHPPSQARDPSLVYRILALDTLEHIDLLRISAQAAGHEVVAVTRIAEAMHFLNTKDHVDVVVSAVHLEQESVFDFLKEMKKSPLHKDVPFMMLCSEPGEFAMAVNRSVQSAATVMGVDKYLTMPEYDVHRLMKEIVAMIPDRPPSKEQDGSE